MNASSDLRFFPAVVCAYFDSPIDALLSLCVPQDEAMDLVAASWRNARESCVLASVDGGRHVAALRADDGRWAACNAFPEQAATTRTEAERRMRKLLKRGRCGLIGTLAGESS